MINTHKTITGGVDKSLLQKIISFLDLQGAIHAMWTCTTWRDLVYLSNADMWANWCKNTGWKFDYPVPPEVHYF